MRRFHPLTPSPSACAALLTAFFVLLFIPTEGSSVVTDKAAYVRQRKASRSSSAHALTLRAQADQSNAYIAATMEDNGEFTIGTVEGDPSRSDDNNADLLYGHPNPGTGDTMISINGVTSGLGSASSSGVVQEGDSLTTTLTVGSVAVKETLTIIRSAATRRPDTIRVSFKVTNNGAAAMIRLRTQLDTLLGHNDGAPFRMPNFAAVTTDTEFDSDGLTSAPAIPSQALVLDSLTAPAVIAQFTFTGIGFVEPDRLVFGYWPVAVGSFDYTVVPGRSFLDHDDDGVISGSSPDSDSSVIIYWGYTPIALGAGQSQEFGFDYGMGNCAQTLDDPFLVLLCGPGELSGHIVGSNYEYRPTPFTYTAFVSNVSASQANGVTIGLNTTPDFELASGQSATHPVEDTAGSGILISSGSAQIDWQLNANGRQIGSRPLSVTLAGAGKRLQLSRPIFVPLIPNTIFGKATESDGSPIVGAAITAFSGTTQVGSAVTQSNGRYVITGLAVGRYTVRLSVSGRPDSYFQADVGDGEEGYTANPGSFQAGKNLETYAYPNPVREGRVRIIFYSKQAVSAEVRIFNSIAEPITTINVDVPGPGWQEVEWKVDNVANGVYFYMIKAGNEKARGKIAVLKRRGI